MGSMVIDVHAHAFPDKLAEKALAALAEHSGDYIPHTDGRISGLLASMDAAGIDAAFIASIATKPSQAEPILAWSEQIRSKRIIPLGSVHPASTGFRQEIAAIRKGGLPGIKLHPMYQDFTIDDPALTPFFSAIEDNRLILLMHAGYDIAFPGDVRALPSRIARLAERHPRLSVIAAHMGGWQTWDEVMSSLAGSGVYLDTSFIREMTPLQRETIITMQGADRLVFGTDSPWIPQGDELDSVKTLLSGTLSTDGMEKVLGGNAKRLLTEHGWDF
jgi:predicted TIM-barrel fold metal-dependent hydrolase